MPRSEIAGTVRASPMPSNTSAGAFGNGQTGRALRLIQLTLTAVKAKADGKFAAARSAAKLTKAMIALETYVSGLADLIH